MPALVLLLLCDDLTSDTAVSQHYVHTPCSCRLLLSSTTGWRLRSRSRLPPSTSPPRRSATAVRSAASRDEKKRFLRARTPPSDASDRVQLDPLLILLLLTQAHISGFLKGQLRDGPVIKDPLIHRGAGTASDRGKQINKTCVRDKGAPGSFVGGNHPYVVGAKKGKQAGRGRLNCGRISRFQGSGLAQNDGRTHL